MGRDQLLRDMELGTVAAEGDTEGVAYRVMLLDTSLTRISLIEYLLLLTKK